MARATSLDDLRKKLEDLSKDPTAAFVEGEVSKVCKLTEQVLKDGPSVHRHFFESCFAPLVTCIAGGSSRGGEGWLLALDHLRDKHPRIADTEALVSLLRPDGMLLRAVAESGPEYRRYPFPVAQLPQRTQLLLRAEDAASRAELMRWPHYAVGTPPHGPVQDLNVPALEFLLMSLARAACEPPVAHYHFGILRAVQHTAGQHGSAGLRTIAGRARDQLVDMLQHSPGAAPRFPFAAVIGRLLHNALGLGGASAASKSASAASRRAEAELIIAVLMDFWLTDALEVPPSKPPPGAALSLPPSRAAAPAAVAPPPTTTAVADGLRVLFHLYLHMTDSSPLTQRRSGAPGRVTPGAEIVGELRMRFYRLLRRKLCHAQWGRAWASHSKSGLHEAQRALSLWKDIMVPWNVVWNKDEGGVEHTRRGAAREWAAHLGAYAREHACFYSVLLPAFLGDMCTEASNWPTKVAAESAGIVSAICASDGLLDAIAVAEVEYARAMDALVNNGVPVGGHLDHVAANPLRTEKFGVFGLGIGIESYWPTPRVPDWASRDRARGAGGHGPPVTEVARPRSTLLRLFCGGLDSGVYSVWALMTHLAAQEHARSGGDGGWEGGCRGSAREGSRSPGPRVRGRDVDQLQDAWDKMWERARRCDVKVDEIKRRLPLGGLSGHADPGFSPETETPVRRISFTTPGTVAGPSTPTPAPARRAAAATLVPGRGLRPTRPYEHPDAAEYLCRDTARLGRSLASYEIAWLARLLHRLSSYLNEALGLVQPETGAQGPPRTTGVWGLDEVVAWCRAANPPVLVDLRFLAEVPTLVIVAVVAMVVRWGPAVLRAMGGA
ncbi:unnamed protein product [Pedinophyceae sp. YPF-701]|nr:unnamed protein product [Pedinophyceae sp. YPF-701]